jgi:hypothetical protein
MRKTGEMRAVARGARLAVFGAGVLLLAGCATGYSFVQPGVAGSGGYYTGDGPYSGQGYYDYYGTGPYYAGTSGYGYYNGTRPYSSPYGYYGPGYGYGYGYDYGSQWIFNLGISNVWNFPGYWGPWYTTGYASWGCGSWRCGNHHHGHHHDHDNGSWRHDDASSLPVEVPHTAGNSQPDFNPGRERAMERTAWRHDHFVRSPRQGAAVPNFSAVPPMPSYSGGQAPRATSFGSPAARPAAAPMRMPAPQAASRAPVAAPQPSFRPAMPMRAAPPAASRTGTNTGTKVQ